MASANTLSNVESTVGSWYKNVPHLPKTGQKWLADNIWWLSLIGAVLGVIALAALIPALLAVFAVTSTVSTLAVGYAPAYAAYTGVSWLSILLSIVGYIFTTVLLVAAINPLKAGKKKGWTLLFWSYLLNFVFAVVSDLVGLNIFSIVSAAIGAAITGYFLFEIHGYFVTKHKTVHHEKSEAK
jgi:hypothetical protein